MLANVGRNIMSSVNADIEKKKAAGWMPGANGVLYDPNAPMKINPVAVPGVDTNASDPWAATVNPTPTPGYNPGQAAVYGNLKPEAIPSSPAMVTPSKTPIQSAVPVSGTQSNQPPAANPASLFDINSIPGLASGMAAGEKMYNQYGWGTQNIKPAVADIMSRYQERLGGFNSPQMAAMRAENSQMINSQMLAAQRQARAQQAAQGVRGAAALAGQQNIADQAIDARAQMENALLAKQYDAQRQALGDYNNAVLGERGTALGSIFGMGNLGQTGAQQQIANTLLAAYIQRLQGGGGGSDSSAADSPMQQLLKKYIGGPSPESQQIESWVPPEYRNVFTQPYTNASNTNRDVISPYLPSFMR